MRHSSEPRSTLERPSRGDPEVKLPIIIHTDEDYDRAQQRVEELNALPDNSEKERELRAIAEAMLAFELRRDEADD